MKSAITILVLALATPLAAGVTYDIRSDSTGLRQMTIAGKVAIDGLHLRMDITNGDNMLFQDNSIVLSDDGGKTMTVLNPSTKNFYQLRLEDVLGSATSILRNMGGMLKLSFDHPHVAVTDAGVGETIEGFPTRKYVLDASYDVNIDAMGQKMTTHMVMNTQSWTTNQLSSELSTFLQARGFRTGIDAIDKLIEAQTTTMKGMPLKQVSTITMNQGGGGTTMVTTSTVSNIVRKTIGPSEFVMPAGYTKVEDPITKMMQQFKQ